VASKRVVGGGQAMVNGAGSGAYLAAFGVETTVTWHRKWATTGGNGVSRVANILGAGCYSPGVPGLCPARVRAHDRRRRRSKT